MEESKVNTTDRAVELVKKYTPHQLAIMVAELECQVPYGWQLVPVEPTEEMVKAATHESVGFGTRAEYRAMLAAAPKPVGE